MHEFAKREMNEMGESSIPFPAVTLWDLVLSNLSDSFSWVFLKKAFCFIFFYILTATLDSMPAVILIVDNGNAFQMDSDST